MEKETYHNNNTNIEGLNKLLDDYSAQGADEDIHKVRYQEELLKFYRLLPYAKNLPPVNLETYKSTPFLFLLYNRYEKNKMIRDMFIKSMLINGATYEQILYIDFKDCYNKIRGYGEDSKFRETLFNPNKKIIVFENLREIFPTDNLDNVSLFWREIMYHVKNNKIKAIFLGASNESLSLFSHKGNAMLESTLNKIQQKSHLFYDKKETANTPLKRLVNKERK